MSVELTERQKNEFAKALRDAKLRMIKISVSCGLLLVVLVFLSTLLALYLFGKNDHGFRIIGAIISGLSVSRIFNSGLLENEKELKTKIKQILSQTQE